MIRKSVFVAFIALICVSCLGSYSEGERLFRNGLYEEAIGEFSRYLFVNVADLKSLHLRARSYEELGEYEKAVEDYQTILHHEPTYAQALAGIGKIFWKTEDYKNAEKYLLLAAKQDGEDFEILLLLGRAMLMNENYKSADEFLQLAKELNPEDASVYFYQGMARSQIGDVLGAAGSFNMCLKYDPDNLTARYNRGLVLLLIGHTTWALEDFETILESNPDHIEALARRGHAKLRLKNPSGCKDLREAAGKGSVYAQLNIEGC
jgi:tetratricopeptide (TPR) repeat protein